MRVLFDDMEGAADDEELDQVKELKALANEKEGLIAKADQRMYAHKALQKLSVA